MSRLILIRHGQASFGSQNYDQLSDLGKQQARWLGAYFAENCLQPTRIITGDMNRHLQTAEGLREGLGSKETLHAGPEQHSGWNEFDFQAVIQAYLTIYPDKIPEEKTARAFFPLLRASLKSWSDGALSASLPETWEDFRQRVHNALEFSTEMADKQTVVVVSSGGAISMALKHIMGFDNTTMINLNLQTRNTGVSEIYFNERDRHLNCFNCVTHLDTLERRSSITYA